MSFYPWLCSILRPKQPKRFRVVHYHAQYFVVQYRWLGLVWVNVTRVAPFSGERTFPLIDSRGCCENDARDFCRPGAFAKHQAEQDRLSREALEDRLATSEYSL